MVQKDNKKEQSQCTPGLRKIIRPELSDFCKMLVDIEASTRDIFNVRTCGRKDKGVRAGIYYFSVFCTSVNPPFISITDICHFWNADASGGVLTYIEVQEFARIHISERRWRKRKEKLMM